MLEGLIDRSIASGKPPSHRAEWEAELYGVRIPIAGLYLWQVHQRLRRRAGSSGFGPNPISWPDIDAFTRHARMSLAPWELEIIEMIDDLYMIEQAKSARARMDQTKT